MRNEARTGNVTTWFIWFRIASLYEIIEYTVKEPAMLITLVVNFNYPLQAITWRAHEEKFRLKARIIKQFFLNRIKEIIYENKYNVKDWTFDVYVTVFDKTNYKSNEKDNTEKESYNQIVEKYKKLLGVSEVNWS